MMVKAASVLLKRRWARSSCRRSRAISDCSAVGRPTLAPADLPARTPPSRSRRHSVIWEEYSPCWRRYAPPWPWVRAASYAARCSSFCAGVNDRRRVGPPKRGCEGSIRPSWGTGVSVEELIRNQSESRPAWDGLAVNRWPQLTLARREEAVVVGAVDAQHEQPSGYQHRRERGVPECDTAGQTMRHQVFHGLRSEAQQLRAQDCPGDHQEIGKGDPTHEAGQ